MDAQQRQSFITCFANIDNRSVGTVVNGIFGNLNISGMRQQVSYGDCFEVRVVYFDEK